MIFAGLVDSDCSQARARPEPAGVQSKHGIGKLINEAKNVSRKSPFAVHLCVLHSCILWLPGAK